MRVAEADNDARADERSQALWLSVFRKKDRIAQLTLSSTAESRKVTKVTSEHSQAANE
jgi:hypothetical protein